MRDNLVVLPALAILLAGNIVQAFTFLNHDVAWVLYSSGRLFDGGVFGLDIVEVNPPLIWWISLVPYAIAQAVGTDPIVAFRLMVFAISVVVTFDFHKKLQGQLPPRAAGLTLAVFAAVVSFGVHRDFGQREHLALMLCLPYLAHAACLADTTGTQGKRHWFASIAAGLGIAFKPHFLLVPVFVELFLILRRRSARQLVRHDVLISMATVILYFLAVVLFARPYLTEVVPAVSDVFWAFGSSKMSVVTLNSGYVRLVGLTLVLLALCRFPGLATIMVFASLGFFGAAVLQEKGYTYHLYPAIALLVTALALCATRGRAAGYAAMIVLGLALYWQAEKSVSALYYRSASGVYGERLQILVDLVQENVGVNDEFLAVSTHPFPGFPVANYARRDWAAASNSRIYLPAIIRLRARELTTADAAVLARAETRERAAMLSDLGDLPKLILVDENPRRHAIGTSSFDFVGFYSEQPEFRAILGVIGIPT